MTRYRGVLLVLWQAPTRRFRGGMNFFCRGIVSRSIRRRLQEPARRMRGSAEPTEPRAPLRFSAQSALLQRPDIRAHVRFDERRLETELWSELRHRRGRKLPETVKPRVLPPPRQSSTLPSSMRPSSGKRVHPRDAKRSGSRLRSAPCPRRVRDVAQAML